MCMWDFTLHISWGIWHTRGKFQPKSIFCVYTKSPNTEDVWNHATNTDKPHACTEHGFCDMRGGRVMLIDLGRSVGGVAWVESEGMRCIYTEVRRVKNQFVSSQQSVDVWWLTARRPNTVRIAASWNRPPDTTRSVAISSSLSSLSHSNISYSDCKQSSFRWWNISFFFHLFCV